MTMTQDGYKLLRQYYAAVAAIARRRYERVLSLVPTGTASREELETAELALLKADLDVGLHDSGWEVRP